jgi:hypothetical protein
VKLPGSILCIGVVTSLMVSRQILYYSDQDGKAWSNASDDAASLAKYTVLPTHGLEAKFLLVILLFWPQITLETLNTRVEIVQWAS